MKLIIIDGGPASGKNTLGDLLIKKFQKIGKKAILIDMDTFVEEFNPRWIWDNEDQKVKDLANARINYSKEIDKQLKIVDVVIATGERFLTREDIVRFISKIKTSCSLYVFHLSVPFALREKRLHMRGPHSLIDLKKDQRDRDEVKNWPGHVYENVNTPEIDASNLMLLIQKRKGLIKFN
jgi:thymidylate kinase